MRTGGQWQFETADELREAAQVYFDWCKANDIEGKVCTTTNPDGSKSTIQYFYPRPFTLVGICKHLHIQVWSTFAERNSKRGEDFEEVILWIRNKVRADQIEGALCKIYNENIVCRLNGIAENMNVQNAPAPNIVDIFAKK